MVLCLLVTCWGTFTICDSKSAAARAQETKLLSGQKKVQANHQTHQLTRQQLAAGTRAFLANCGRCHNPPQDLTPREACAVIRQMRVRAMLSARDAKLILLLWRHDPPSSQRSDSNHDQSSHTGGISAVDVPHSSRRAKTGVSASPRPFQDR